MHRRLQSLAASSSIRRAQDDPQLTLTQIAGASSVTILDAGCGPGTRLRRIIMHARRIGFSKITARGFDVALAQIQGARRLARDLARLPCVDLTFEVSDLLDRLPEPDASVDIALCLYSVLSHLPISELPKIAAEFGRHFITTARSIGSTPTVFVDSIDRARHFKLDHHLDRRVVEFSNGCRVAVRFHLFTAHQLGVPVSATFCDRRPAWA